MENTPQVYMDVIKGQIPRVHWYFTDHKDGDDFMVGASPEFLKALQEEVTRVAYNQYGHHKKDEGLIEFILKSDGTWHVVINNVHVNSITLRHLPIHNNKEE